MSLQSKAQLYRGLLKNLSGAVVSVPGQEAWTTDSQSFYVSDGTSFKRVASQTKAWPVAGISALRTVVQAAGGNALVGDIAVDTVGKATYLLTQFANKIWLASTTYVLGDTIIDSNGNLQTVTTAGQSGGTEPTWHTTGTTTDNGVVWTESAGFVQISTIPDLSAYVKSVNGITPNPVTGAVTITQDNVPSGTTYTAVKWAASATSKEWVQYIGSDGTQHLSVIKLTDLNDTNISSPVTGQVLVYDTPSAKWINTP